MNIDNASNFLISSILLAVSLLILAAAFTAINNLLHKYWKPVTLFSQDSWTLFGSSAEQHYVDNHPEMISARKAEKRIPPVLEEIKEKK